MSIALPGYVPDVSDGDTIVADWGDAIRDRAPQIFADTTTRDAAITSPKVGQSCIITTGSNAGLYVFAGATDGWRPPWDLEWGELARTVLTTASGVVADAAEHTVTGAATTFTAVANRKYRVTISGAFRPQQAAGTASTVTIKVKDGTTLIEQARAPVVDGSKDAMFSFSVETTLTAGSHTVNVTQQNSNAAGVNQVGTIVPLVVIVEDIGPSGAPS